MPKFEKPVPGKIYGCNDTDKPESVSEYELSRIYDRLREAGEAWPEIWSCIPNDTKLEFNYSNWRYVLPTSQEAFGAFLQILGQKIDALSEGDKEAIFEAFQAYRGTSQGNDLPLSELVEITETVIQSCC